jgi:hypothetical protein
LENLKTRSGGQFEYSDEVVRYSERHEEQFRSADRTVKERVCENEKKELNLFLEYKSKNGNPKEIDWSMMNRIDLIYYLIIH